MPVADLQGGSSVSWVHSVETPIGPLLLSAADGRLTGVTFAGAIESRSSDPLLVEAEAQLHAYFGGELERFQLPLAPLGTAFQRRVWHELEQIPYGETASYGEIAVRLGLPPGASRAVGTANGSNPIAIVVPCHRVIGANGTLTGYAGGLHRKRYLLDLESQASQPQLFEDDPTTGRATRPSAARTR
jgi:methylated-DNA-[protein]-cysteine S-methyltransferase